MQHGVNRLLALPTSRNGFSHLGKLDLGHDAENVIFALKIIEEGSLAYVRGFGDVLDRYGRKSTLGKELQCTAKEAQAGLRSSALTAAGSEQMNQATGRRDGRNGAVILTLDHIRILGVYDHESYIAWKMLAVKKNSFAGNHLWWAQLLPEPGT
jgi:hypothetical protein